MAKVMLSALIIGACLVPGLSSLLKDPNQPPGTYLVSDPAKSYQVDESTGQFVTYKIIPLNLGDSRQKRQVSEEADKATVNSKSIPGTKKPALLNPKGPAPPTLSKPSQNDSNKATLPTLEASTNKPIFIDAVPASVNTSKPNISPKDRISTNTNVTSGVNASESTPLAKPGSSITPTSIPMDSDDMQPTFPYSHEFDDDLKNSTNISRVDDHHKYYNSSFFPDGRMYWVNLDDHPNTLDHELLSDAHRRAATLKLPFHFPFYGHIVDNVTVATGGFLYLGEQVHAWLAATQYVAPLMANFDSRFPNASVRYLSNDANFTVEWHDVRLQDASDRGAFTFQTTLHKNGTIVFAFRDIPFPVNEINDTQHPVKVGLSDAYISDRVVLFVKQKTIYEYHRIDLTPHNITNGAAIVFTSLPTCLSYTSCQDCTEHESGFDCEWCPSTSRCSDGTDRHRQEWLSKNCKIISFKTKLECFVSPPYHHNIGQDDGHDTNHLHLPDAQEKRQSQIDTESSPRKLPAGDESHGMAAASVFGILFLFAVVFAGVGWVVYAYYYPHSPSGQVLIRFRPSQWRSFRRGEARYTAASIHM